MKAFPVQRGVVGKRMERTARNILLKYRRASVGASIYSLNTGATRQPTKDLIVLNEGRKETKRMMIDNNRRKERQGLL